MSTSTVRQHAERIAAALPAGDRVDLAFDPARTLRMLGFELHPVANPTDARGAAGSCDGLSFAENQSIIYRRTDNRRENFTLVHEFAHFTVKNDPDAIDWLADQAEPGVELERLCDQIAANILVPTSLVDRHLAGEPVQAHHATDLFNDSQASYNAIWSVDKFHAPTRDHDIIERPEAHLDCPCGYHGDATGYPCDSGHQFCPSCRECLCFYSTRNHVPCPNPNCFMVVPARDIVNGRCGMCG